MPNDMLGGFTQQDHQSPTTFEVKYIRDTGIGQPRYDRRSLLGKGALSLTAQEIVISGKRHRLFWFGAAQEHRFDAATIVNAHAIGKDVRFEIDDTDAVVRHVHLRAADAQAALQILALLPTRLTDAFAQEYAERSDFQQRLDTVSPSAPLTNLIVAANVIVFVLMALNGAGWMNANGEVAVRWGSNFGPMTLSGEWWRLFTSTFIHFGLLHLALNMFALYQTGRLVERIYGSVHFLLLYVLAGLAGSMVSILWHPEINSAGASGAIFGVFGGLFAFMSNKKNAVPSAIMHEHLSSTFFFIAFNLVNGFAHAGIDNGAHIGGLLGGAVFGYLLSRPLEIKARAQLLTPRLLIAITASIALLAALSYPLTHPSESAIAEREFSQHLRDFGAQEPVMLEQANALVKQMQSDAITYTDFADALDLKIVPQWQHWHAQLAAHPLAQSSKNYPMQQTLLRYVDDRLRGYLLIAQSVRTNDKQVMRQADDAMNQSQIEVENFKKLMAQK